MAEDDEEAGEVVQARPGPNGQIAKDRKAERTGKVMIEIRDGCVYWKGILWMLNIRNLIRQILESEHHTNVASHMCQDPALTTPCCSTGSVGSVLRGKLVITLPAYSRAARSHTSGVLTHRS